jgi:hypothetical protein
MKSFELYAQDENKFSKSIENFSVSYFQALNTGNNFLSKAHNFKQGFTAELNVKTYKRFYLGFGYSHSKYEVTNREKVGEYSRGNHVSGFINISLVYEISKNISLNPQCSFGISYFNAKKSNVDIRNLYGLEGKIGTKVIYELSNEFGIVGTIHYCTNRFDMYANEDIKNFYNQSHSINFGLGIILF